MEELLKTINAHHLSRLSGVNYAKLADTLRYQNSIKLNDDEVDEIKYVLNQLMKRMDDILREGRSL